MDEPLANAPSDRLPDRLPDRPSDRPSGRTAYRASSEPADARGARPSRDAARADAGGGAAGGRAADRPADRPADGLADGLAGGPAGEVTPPAALLEDLAAALGATGEAFAIVARDTRLVLWCSAGCEAVHAALRVGRPAAAVAGLERLLDAVEAGETPAPFALAASLPDVDGRDGTPPRDPGTAAAAAPFTVALASAGEARVTLRFHRAARPDDYLQRYVADREKLFMVSRSVSVSEMATTLAHELNQPIGAIANLLRGLQVLLAREHDGELPQQLGRALARASDQTRFAAGIIARVRTFTEARTPRLVACEAGRLLAGTIELLDWVFDSEAVQVRLEAEAGPLFVSGDEILLQQVFANLLRNAVDAMRGRPRAGRRIHVRVARDVDGVAVEIRDNGAGLGESAAETPFEPFRSNKRGGMGIGLNICRSFVEMHRGKLWLTPAEGGGCVAHVLLPERRA